MSGAYQIACPDSPIITLPSEGICSVNTDDDGNKTIACGDNTMNISAGCPDGFPGDVVSFTPSYPGDPDTLQAFAMSGCTVVHGDVAIGSSSNDFPRTSLPDALQRITKIDGELYMDTLRDVSISMPNLTEIGGDFTLSDTDGLTEVGDFSKLESIGGWFTLNNNENLNLLNNFSSLTTVQDAVITNNPELSQCDIYTFLTEQLGLSRTSTSDHYHDGNDVDTCGVVPPA